jgi:hypothetical protein
MHGVSPGSDDKKCADRLPEMKSVGYAGIFANADDNDSHLNSKGLFMNLMYLLPELSVTSYCTNSHQQIVFAVLVVDIGKKIPLI